MKNILKMDKKVQKIEVKSSISYFTWSSDQLGQGRTSWYREGIRIWTNLSANVYSFDLPTAIFGLAKTSKIFHKNSKISKKFKIHNKGHSKSRWIASRAFTGSSILAARPCSLFKNGTSWNPM